MAVKDLEVKKMSQNDKQCFQNTAFWSFVIQTCLKTRWCWHSELFSRRHFLWEIHVFRELLGFCGDNWWG